MAKRRNHLHQAPRSIHIAPGRTPEQSKHGILNALHEIYYFVSENMLGKAGVFVEMRHESIADLVGTLEKLHKQGEVGLTVRVSPLTLARLYFLGHIHKGTLEEQREVQENGSRITALMHMVEIGGEQVNLQVTHFQNGGHVIIYNNQGEVIAIVA